MSRPWGGGGLGAPGEPATVLFVEAHGDRWGAQVVVHDIAAGLDRTRFEPMAACLNDGSLVDGLRRSGVPTFVLRSHRVSEPVRFAQALRELQHLVRRHRVNIVHANAEFMLLYAWAAGLGRRTRLVWHVYDGLPDDPLRDHRLRHLTRRIRPDWTIFGTPGVNVSYEAFYRRLGPTSVVLPGARDVDGDGPPVTEAVPELGIPEGAPVVLMLARFQRHKGHLDLADAAALVRQKVPDAFFVVTGSEAPGLEAGYREEVADRVRAHGLEDRWVFTGFVDEDSKWRLLRRAHLLVHPARHEAFGIALIEAMACGRPVVAAAAPGPVSIVDDGVTGLLVPLGDVDELADALVRLLDDEGLCAAMGDAGRRLVAERYSVGAMVRRVEAIYDALLRP